jgi:hypothetical protein
MPAILNKADGEHLFVTIPEGAMLDCSAQPSNTLLGMVGVYWQGRHYSIYPRDLLQKAERVSAGGA